MAVDLGTAEGYLRLDLSQFQSSLSRAESLARSSSTSLKGSFSTVGKTITSVGKTMTTSLTVPVVAAGAAIVKTSASFEKGLSKVKSVTGATTSQMNDLKNKAMDMGAKTKFSASEAADAMYYMGLAGWDSKQIMSGLKGVMDLAAASGEDLATTSDIVTDSLTGFGLKAEDTSHFVNLLAKTSSSSNTTVSLMGETFKYVAPLCGALGYSADDAALAIGIMANAGIKGSQAGTSLRTALTNMVKPTKKMADKMKELGISTKDANGKMLPLKELLLHLRDRFKGLSKDEQAAAAAAIFGKESMSGMLAIINASDEDFDSLADSISNCDEQMEGCNGTAEYMAKTMNDNLAGQWTILKSTIETIALQFGEVLVPAMKNVVARLQEFATWFTTVDEKTKRMIVTIAAVAAAIGPVLFLVGKFITLSIKIFDGLKAIKAALLVIKGAIAACSAPVLAIVAVVALLVAAFASLWKTNEEFRDKMISIWNKIKNTVKKFCDGIVERVNELGFEFKDIVDLLQGIWEGFCDIMAPIFEGAFNQISVILSSVLDALTGIFDVFIGIFTGDWDKAWTGVKEIFGSVWDLMKGTVESWSIAIKGVVDTVLGWFGTDWNSLWSGVSSFFKNVWNGISSFFMNIWNGIISFLEPVLEQMSAAFATAWDAIKLVWDLVSPYFLGIWSAIKAIFSVVATVLGSFFSNAWEVIKAIWSVVVGWFTLVWENIKAVFSVVATVLGSFFSNAWDAIKAIWDTVVSYFTLVWAGIQAIFAVVKSVLSGDFSSAWDAIKNVWDKAKGFFGSVWDSIKTVFSGVGSFFSTTFGAAWEAVKKVFSNWGSFFSGLWSTISNTFSKIGTNIANAISGSVRAGLNGVISSIEGIVNTGVNLINGAIGMINKIPGVDIGKLNKLKLPRLAKGGVVNKATIAEIGEDGREAVVPLEKNLGWIRNLVGLLFERAKNEFGNTFKEIFDMINNVRKNVEKMLKLQNTFVVNFGDYIANSARSVKVRQESFVNNRKNGIASSIKDKSENAINRQEITGNNFNFYSKSKLSEVESAKEMKKAIFSLAET